MVAVAAVDLGASSGRVMVGTVRDSVALTEVHRFPNTPIDVLGTLHWDILSLYRGVLDGLRAAGDVASIGIDSWAIDYGLLDEGGALLGNPVHYRDHRTQGVAEKVDADIPAAELYQITGVQRLPFNTLYQLIAAADTPALRQARTMLLVPDLLAYWLTGEIGAEATNASTTQLYDVRRQEWAADLIRRVRIPAQLFPPLRRPGDPVGRLLPAVSAETGLAAGTPVTAVGSHDTASAVVGVPAQGRRFAYVSCGTWSLVGVELDAPVLTPASRLANFTNETGVDGRIRYLRNVMGLWLLQECLRTWQRAGRPADVEELVRAAAGAGSSVPLVDPDDPVFLPPGDMPARIAQFCRRTNQTPPQSQADTVRCILDSLAVAYRRAVREAQALAGHPVDVVHIVGGGARNGLLCQLTADACGLPVVAGPVEAAALGNVVVQARAVGAVHGDIDELRALLRRGERLSRYEPNGDEERWAAAERRLY